MVAAEVVGARELVAALVEGPADVVPAGEVVAAVPAAVVEISDPTQAVLRKRSGVSCCFGAIALEWASRNGDGRGSKELRPQRVQ